MLLESMISRKIGLLLQILSRLKLFFGFTVKPKKKID